MRLSRPNTDFSLRLHASHTPAVRTIVLLLAILLFILTTVMMLPPIPEARGIAGYLPLHTTLETIAVVIAILVFAVGWNAYSSKLPGNVVFVACMFLGVGVLDFTHILSYPGMPDFITPSSPDKAIDFWLAARLIAASALLVFALSPWRPFASAATRYLLLASVVAVTALMHWIFLYHHELLPDTFIIGQGLTPFKINAEYTLIAVNIITAFLLWLRMRQAQPFHMAALFGAVCTMAMSEFLFTLYADVTDIYNLLGHIYKAVSYLFIYHAIFVTTVKRPYKQLRNSQNSLQATLNAIPDMLFEMGLDGRLYHYHTPGYNTFAASDLSLLAASAEIQPQDLIHIELSDLRNAYQTGYAKGEYELALPTGKHWFEFSMSRKAVDEGEEPRFVVLSRDITDRKKAEEQLSFNEKLLTQTQEVASIGSWMIDMQYDKLLWSAETYRIFGIPYGSPVSYEFFIAKTHPDDRAYVNRAWNKALKGSGYHIQHRIIVNDQIRWVEERAHLDFDAHGNLVAGTGSVQDITDSKQAEQALRESEQFLLQSQSIANLGSYIFDLQKGSWKSSEVLDRLLGIDEHYPRDIQGWRDLIHPKDRAMVETYIMQDVIGGREPFDKEYRIVRHKDGAEQWVHGLGKLQFDPSGTPHLLQGTIQNITEKKYNEARIENLAHFDQLTGLPNRTLLNDRITYSLNMAQRNKKKLTVMFLDLDHFKMINDTLGHSIGDRLLIEAARRLKESIREEDTVSRMGGDEFVMIFPDTDFNSAIHIAPKLIGAISQPYHIDEHELVISTSIGIAIYPDDGNDFETLSKNADTAMYRIKQGNRNDFCFFTQEMQEDSIRNLQLVNAMRQALSRNELQVHYQPQISMYDGYVIGAEALLRWEHPEFGFISPAEFIPIAENSGQIIQIGEWVIRTAVMQAKKWIENGLPPMLVAVNLSAVQFRQPDLSERIIEILDEAQLPHECLELELTEAATMEDPNTAIAVMDKLHAQGVRMSIDDFGTGYSSLSHLKRFNVYKLKIDQSFVCDITEDPDDMALVSTIINMANDLGMRTIAEGVETAEQLNILQQQGCDEIQGYYFSKPLPADEFSEFVCKSYTALM